MSSLAAVQDVEVRRLPCHLSSAQRNALVSETYHSYQRQLRGFFMRTVDEGEAEDLLHELFIRLIRQVDRIPPDNCKGFLFAAAANLLRDRWRRRAVRKLDEMASFDDLGDFVEDFSEVDPCLWSEQAEQLQSLNRALGHVSASAAKAFVAHRVDGESYAKIAVEMGVSVSMVEKYISSVLVMLRRFRL